MRRHNLARQAIRAATQVRSRVQALPGATVCPIDIAIQLDVGVQFMALPSLEGMYSIEPRAMIIIGSERPCGRKRFTCAHELGHHVFEHGTRVDQLTTPSIDRLGGEGTTDDEYLADNFAAALLMPKSVVDAALHRRGWLRRPFTPRMVFIVAQDIGVGYTSLVHQLTVVLRYLSFSEAKELKRHTPRDLRPKIARFPIKRDLFCVDETWGTRPVDVEVGDILLHPPDTHLDLRKGPLSLVQEPKPHLLAQHPGVTKLVLSSRTIDVRVSRNDYAGPARYRHLEEPEPEEVSDEE